MFRSLLTFAAALMLIAAPAGQARAAMAEAGQPAPVFTATDTRGQSVSLADLQGKTVILEWTNHQCPFVVKHYETGNMQALQKELTGEGAVWISVVSSAPGKQGHVSPEEADRIVEEQGAAPTHKILDESGEIGHMYGAATTPHMFVIDPRGVLVYAGAIDDNSSARHDSVEGARNYVRSAFNAVQAGKSPDPASTRPYGCSVKY